MFEHGLVLARIKGIPIRAHVTLLLFMPYVAFITAAQYKEIAGALDVSPNDSALPPLAWGAILAVGLFVAILLHELAHSVIALRAGAKVRSITLMMLGGVSQIENDVPADKEAWMAFAGPLVSFAIAAVSYLAARAVPKAFPGLIVALLVFATMNAIIAAFNLLPAFPMDGGRVLRGLLSRYIGRPRATRIATQLGKGLAIVFGLVGLMGFNLLLMLVALFIYMGASAEDVRTEARDFLRGVPVTQMMSDRLGDAGPNESAQEVASRLIRNNQLGARVVESNGYGPGGHGREMGIVTAWDLVKGRDAGQGAATVESAMRRDFPKVHVYDDASKTLDVLANEESNVVAVLDESEHVVGIVTPQEMQRAVALIEAMGPRSSSTPPSGAPPSAPPG